MKSRHAKVRMQQRGVPPLVVHWLRKYGEEQHDHDGGVVRFFSKRSKKHMRRGLGNVPVKRMADYLDAYLVEKGGVVVTVGHRFKRIVRY